MKKIIVMAGFLAVLITPLWMSPSQADPVHFTDQGNYFTDTLSGTDWLKLTETTNQSFNQVSGQLGNGGTYEGWRYATSSDLIGMLSNWAGTPLTLDTSSGERSFPGGTSQAIFDLLGVTYQTSTSKFSEGLLADSPEAGERHLAQVLLDTMPFDYFAYDIYSATFSEDEINTGVGSFLIRGGDISAIPLPAAVWVFGAALGGLGWLARRRKTS